MPATLERPPTLAPPDPYGEDLDDPPATVTRRRRRWLRYLFPWLKTAVGAPIADDALIIVNETDHTWLCTAGYHTLGLVLPHEKKVTSVVRKGTLTARRLNAPDADPLAVAMTPSVRVVQISADPLDGAEVFSMWAVSSPAPTRVHEYPLI